MPAESRFRLVRPFDIAEAFAQRRSGGVRILVDERPEPTRLRAAAAVTPVTQRPLGIWATGGGVAPSSLRTPGTGIGRERSAFGMVTPARENTQPVGGSSRRRARRTNSVLPSWYPRTPLRDITAITRAIERRRSRLGEENGSTAQVQVPSLHGQDAPPEHQVLAATPSTIKKRPRPPSVLKVHKVLLEVANQPDEGEFLTPQKKLLNSIDKVEKVVLEELQRLKRTPSAKKAERERKVRTLMSMR
ncbi:PREDICTED: protein POLYCHOME-like [Fragaria vesca subsp. vesca]|uniref:protein POLYCHOME-like n=1 Tax=Fragaria vesca subsp. vesca TaxID=101020 RepID=UPI0002C32810|nr:PREDICTED: protein POLYCHOME-like [Fragaria vesca subsp. vesca]